MDNVESKDLKHSEENSFGDIKDFQAFKNLNKIDLSFNNVSYKVRRHALTLEKKTVLHNVCGEFKAGELTAIMGPSGAGKTCLMNILASYITGKGITGDVMVNGRPRKLASYRRSIAYIMQDDHLHPDLTVLESMLIAAKLKLQGSSKFKIDRVKFIMKLMGLEQVGTTFTQDLSGGQRKRLVIAFELIGDSSVMFFDEPTSHLDSVTSKQCVEMLKLLARGGRNVICTIHQPSATLLNTFDHLYVVAKGRCIYDGSIPDLLPFLRNFGLHCPPYHNPSDFLLDIASDEYGDNVPRLVEAIEQHRSHAPDVKYSPEVDEQIKIRRTGSGFWTQFSVLLYSNVLRMYRNRDLPMNIILAHLGTATFLGFLYWDVGKDASRILDNAKLTFFNMVFISFCAISSSLQSIPYELPVLKRESFNSWYSVHVLYIAKKLTYAFVTTISTIVYIVIVYFMSNQLFEWNRFGLVILQNLLIAILTLTAGIAFGAGLPPKISLFLGLYSFMPHFMFSGLFIRYRDTVNYMKVFFDFSIYKHGFEGNMLAIYGYDRERLECSEFCYSSSPSFVLNEFDMQNADYWQSARYLGLLYLTANFIAYIIIVCRLKR